MNDLLGYLNDIVKQLLGLSPEALLILGIIVLGYILRRIKRFPNELIPAVCVVAGAILYPFIAAPDPSIKLRHPAVRLVMIGALIGFIAWVAHNKFLAPLEGRFPWLKQALAGEQPEPSPESPAQKP